VREVGELQKAKEFQEQALLILRRRLGTEHLTTAGCMNALGLTFKYLEAHREALDMYNGALGVQRRALGASHHECLATMHNMAECYKAAGDKGKAEHIQAQISRLLQQQEN